jgi:magnesium chelatase family protein
MPVAHIGSAALWGVEAHPVVVEVDVSPGLPVLTTVGLPDSAVRESRVRVKSAIQNSGFQFPSRRVAVNLAPADLPKQGSGLDLPIALGILAASGQIGGGEFPDAWAIGELSLEGGVRPVPGIVPVLLAARRHRIARVLVPARSSASAALIAGVQIWEVGSLREAAGALAAEQGPPPGRPAFSPAGSGALPAAGEGADLADVRGQAGARRALEIAASGGHSLLMIGPPGAGKTMLAQRLPGLLPDLDEEEALEVSCVYSVAEPERMRTGPARRPPFRAPHHTLSMPALIGGGADPKPGELSLAHCGVLFLDELGEFRPWVLEALRQPLEEGEVRIARHRRALRFPARPILIAALNPCRCAWRGDPVRPCTCTPAELRRHERVLSGALLDRIDLQIEVPRPDPAAWSAPVEASAAVRGRVAVARGRMRERTLPGIRERAHEPAHTEGRAEYLNARLPPSELARHCRLGRGAEKLLAAAVEHFALSPRVRHRILKVARTIADLDGAEDLSDRHVAEAVQYRVGRNA